MRIPLAILARCLRKKLEKKFKYNLDGYTLDTVKMFYKYSSEQILKYKI